MERHTILMLDSDARRGGVLEHGLSRLGLNVFRTSRNREANNLLRVLQPVLVVIALEGEGAAFYQRYISSNHANRVRCVVLASPHEQQVQKQDLLLDKSIPLTQLSEKIYQCAVNEAKTQNDIQDNNWRDTPTPTNVRTVKGRLSDDSKKSGAISRNASAKEEQGTSREWKGSLTQLDVARLLSILLRRRATGKLLLTHQSETKRIWFLNGVVVSADSNQTPPRLPHILMQEGIVTEMQLRQHPQLFVGARLGERLYRLHLIEQHQIELINQRYVHELIIGSFSWEQGGFCFLPGAEDLPGTPLSIDLPSLLLQGTREGYRLERLLRLLGNTERIPSWFSNRIPELQLPLNPLDRKIIEQIDGQRTLNALRRFLRVEATALYALIYTLSILGYLTLQESKGEAKGAQGRPGEGVKVASSQPSSILPYNQTKTSTYNSFRAGKGGQAGTRESERYSRNLAVEMTPVHPLPAVQPPEATPSSPDINPMAGAGNTNSRIRTPTMSYRAVMSPRAGNRTSVHRPFSEFPQNAPGSQSPSHGEDSAESLQFISQVKEKYESVMTEDYFKILGVSEQANNMEIRRAYQRLKQSFSETRFSETTLEKVKTEIFEVHQTIQEAYEVLGDPVLRERYRRNLER